jgi:hypothetical protein
LRRVRWWDRSVRAVHTDDDGGNPRPWIAHKRCYEANVVTLVSETISPRFVKLSE